MKQEAPDSFNVFTEVKVDFKASTDYIFNQYGASDKSIVLFNLKSGMCQAGQMQSHDGGINYYFMNSGTYPIRESNEGLQWYDGGSMGWRYFDNGVQEVYMQFLLEKELK